MKNKVYYLFIMLFVITLAGCTKFEQRPVVLPEGNFTGTFRRIHLNPIKNERDTVNVNLIVSLAASTGYAVNGDTATVHAGSKGSYIVDQSLIQFVDSTIPANNTAIPAKIHLAGLYQYLYDGKNLLINASNDTLNLFYKLQKP